MGKSYVLTFLLCVFLRVSLDAGTISAFRAPQSAINVNGEAASGTLGTLTSGLASGIDCSGCSDVNPGGNSCPDMGDCCSEPRYNRPAYNSPIYDTVETPPSKRIPLELSGEYINRDLSAFSFFSTIAFGFGTAGIDLGFDHFEEKIPGGYDVLNIYTGGLSVGVDSDEILRVGIGLMGIGSVFTYQASGELNIELSDNFSVKPRLSFGFFKDVIIKDISLRMEIAISKQLKYFIGFRDIISPKVEIKGIQSGMVVYF